MPDAFDLYPKPQSQPNPLAIAQQVAGLMGPMNQNRLFQQEFEARQAIGPIYQQSIDPNTGRLDTNLLLKLAASDPRTAFKAGELVQQATERERAQVGIDADRFKLANDQLTAMNARVSTLLLKPNGQLGTGDVLSALTDLVKEERVRPQDAANFISQLPAEEDGIRLVLQQRLTENLSNQERLNAIYGSTEQVAAGGSTQILSTSPLTGARPVANVPTTLTPGEATEPVPVVDPATGLPTSIPRSQFAQVSGAPAGVGTSTPTIFPAPAPAGGNALLRQPPVPSALPGAAPRPAGLGGGVPANPLLGGAEPTAPADPSANPFGINLQQPQPAPRPELGVQTGLPPGAAEAAGVVAEDSAKQLVGLRTEVASSPTRLFQLNKALEALRNTTTGPGTEGRNAILSFLSAAPGINRLVPDFVAKDVQNFDEAKKYLEQYAQAAANSLGSGTDAKLASALSANASVKISNLAAQDVVKANIGLERYKQAQLKAFEQERLRPEQFGQWSAQWATKVDPRAFVSDLLSKEKRAAMIQGMTDREQQLFLQTRAWAKQQGLM